MEGLELKGSATTTLVYLIAGSSVTLIAGQIALPYRLGSPEIASKRSGKDNAALRSSSSESEAFGAAHDEWGSFAEAMVHWRTV